MLNSRRNQARTNRWSQPAPISRPGARGAGVTPRASGDGVQQTVTPMRHEGRHPLGKASENGQLFEYEQRTKSAFDAIVPTLKQVAAMQHEPDFEVHAQAVAREQLGYELPQTILADAWVSQLDMRQLFAWCVFKTYQRYCDEFFISDPLGAREDEFQKYLVECGFHTLDVSPCADGRLAHVIRYVLRLPHRAVRRKSYAGAMFDIDDSLDKWTETELQRFREGVPSTVDAATRYLKVVVYHYSSVDPDHEGCAAHGSDAGRAAAAGKERLLAFQQAVENSFCCGASIDLMLIGLNTDTDAIRIHVPDEQGEIDLNKYVDAAEIFEATRTMAATIGREWIYDYVMGASPDMPDGMIRFMSTLLENNISQIEYVQQHHGKHYEDIGHAERFIGAGIGFEEVQLRNLTFFAYLRTVEEAATDLDVGIKIFRQLNVSHGLPIPVIVRFDYHGVVPGARERAIQHCQRVSAAAEERYAELFSQGLLHILQVIRDCHAGESIEIIDSSVNEQVSQEAH